MVCSPAGHGYSTVVGGSSDGSEHASGTTDETKDERLNRELIELLNELRVALPGVQVLFAFLLTVPFSSRFESLGDAQQALYFATIVGTAFATILFMAPVAYHRIQFRQRDKEHLIRTSNRFAIVGTIFLALSITCAASLITELLFGPAAAFGVAAAILLLIGWAWYAIPLSRRVRDDEV
jgi:Family of unknown function (DUF6328)